MEPSGYAAATSANQQCRWRIAAAVIADEGERQVIGLQPVTRQKGEQ
jgi:hypothetical protein